MHVRCSASPPAGRSFCLQKKSLNVCETSPRVLSLSLPLSASRDMKGRVAVEGGEDGTSQGGKSHDPPHLSSQNSYEKGRSGRRLKGNYVTVS